MTKTARVDDPFSLVAPLYDLFSHTGDAARLKQLLRPTTGDLILDVGGGTGRIARQLLPSAGGVVVLDPSTAMLRRNQPAPGLMHVRATAEALPFPDETFSRVVVVDAFHHFASRPLATRELWRVLAPGGRLVVEEPDIRSRVVRLIAFGEWILRFGSVFWEPPRIAQAFTALGATAAVEPGGGHVSHVVVEKP